VIPPKHMASQSSKPPGIIERIERAESAEEVKQLVAHAVGFTKANDMTLRRINRAAVKRNKELSRP
jgi:hypothetical protein